MFTQEHCPSGNIRQLEEDLLKFCPRSETCKDRQKTLRSPKPVHHLQRETHSHPVSQSHDKGIANLITFLHILKKLFAIKPV